MFCVRWLLSNVGAECTNGMGRREAFADPNHRCRYRADRCGWSRYFTRPDYERGWSPLPLIREIDGTRRFLSRFGDANKLVIRW